MYQKFDLWGWHFRKNISTCFLKLLLLTFIGTFVFLGIIIDCYFSILFLSKYSTTLLGLVGFSFATTFFCFFRGINGLLSLLFRFGANKSLMGSAIPKNNETPRTDVDNQSYCIFQYFNRVYFGVFKLLGWTRSSL